MILRTKDDYLPKQQQLIRLCNTAALCILKGVNQFLRDVCTDFVKQTCHIRTEFVEYKLGSLAL